MSAICSPARPAPSARFARIEARPDDYNANRKGWQTFVKGGYVNEVNDWI